MSHPLLDPQPKTPFVIVAVQYSRMPQTYYFRAPKDMGIEPGDRIVTPKNESFTIPTVVGVYPADCEMAGEATDWVVLKVDTTRYQELKREYAL